MIVIIIAMIVMASNLPCFYSDVPDRSQEVIARQGEDIPPLPWVWRAPEQVDAVFPRCTAASASGENTHPGKISH